MADFSFSDSYGIDLSPDLTGDFSNSLGTWDPSGSLSTAIADTTTNSPAPSTYTPPSTSFETTVSNAFNWGLKASNNLVDAYGKYVAVQGKAQDTAFNQYLKTSQIDILRTQAASAADIAKIKAQTDANIAMIYKNTAGSAQNLAALGGNSNSLMLYLTVAGLIFTFISVIKK